MDIGNKLLRARTKANLTQEQVADALGLSRQTISNWENEKTYPDIRSVVTLSDLYDVSLDYLLKEKEETAMTNYLDYLEESTNAVKSKTRLSKIILIATYLGIWAFALITFWFFTSGTDAIGFSFVFLWIVLPVSTFVISLLIGKNNYWSKWKRFVPIIFGIMHMIAEYSTFSMRNMIASNRINMPQFDRILVGAFISLIGLWIGHYIHCKKARINKQEFDYFFIPKKRMD